MLDITYIHNIFTWYNGYDSADVLIVLTVIIFIIIKKDW